MLLADLFREMLGKPLHAVSSPTLEACPKRVQKPSLREMLELGIIPPIRGGADVAQFPLFRHIYAEQYIDPANRTNGTVNGATLDLQAKPYNQFDHFSVVVLVGVTDGTLDVKAQHDGDSAMGSPTDVVGGALTQFGATDDNKFGILEVPSDRILERYFRTTHVVGASTVGVLYGVILVAYRYQGEFPTPAASDRKAHTVVAV